LNQRINLLKLKKNLIPTNKKASVRRLFEPEMIGANHHFLRTLKKSQNSESIESFDIVNP